MGRIRIKKKIRNKTPALGDCGTLNNYGNIVFKVVNIQKNFLLLEEITEKTLKIKVLISKHRLIKEHDNTNNGG